MLSLNVLTICAFVSVAAAHVDINWPKGQWNFTEDQQEEGGLCGGGSPESPWAFSVINPFISISGDSGQLVTIRVVTSNSTSADSFPDVDSADDFNITIAENVTISDSGNLCINATALPPLNLVPGAQGILYVAASDPDTGSNVSSCASVVFVSAPLEGEPVRVNGEVAVNPDTNANYTFREYYCSNTTTLPAVVTCDCHCHDATEHCDSSCTEEEVADAKEECEAASGGGASSTSTSASGSEASADPDNAGVSLRSRALHGSFAGVGMFLVALVL